MSLPKKDILSRHVVREAKASIMRADEFQKAGIDRTFRETMSDYGANGMD